MKKLSIVALCVIFIIGCSKVANYSVPTEQQLIDFLRSEDITPLDIHFFKDTAVVLHGTEFSNTVSFISYENIKKEHVINSSTTGNDNPLTFIPYKGSDRDPSFIAIFLNDSQLVADAAKIIVDFDGTPTETEIENRRGIIVSSPNPKPTKKMNVLIYGNENRLLYSNEL
ncbi:hypothetical protein PAE9249_04044 [Paenibacillus sp. CECT 9249]|uniref:hypothetical protein n=1 Tax=Paenibacillus sp. CECT 9249 TaxID=2845385 RepID=UPI001E34276A|nr:hypothetical protein [Paenibacillus sp. CECT 9249]CAH0121513.1 hypothetical protein PAE9249_04044 [Paenibacillus sp. CECT 9249]